MSSVIYQVNKNTENGKISRGLYQRERVALAECKRLNDRVILLLTKELATLNGAMRGSGRPRRVEIENILTNLPYSVTELSVNDQWS